jgi:hypothetical protein
VHVSERECHSWRPAQARAGSAGNKGDGCSLGVDGGASGHLVARLRPLAYGRHLVSNGVRMVSVGEREEER